MSSTNRKVLEFFANIPRLEANGSNWVNHRDRFLSAAAAASLVNHIDGTGVLPKLVAIPRFSYRQFEELILKPSSVLPTDKPLVIIVDALDECAEHWNILLKILEDGMLQLLSSWACSAF